ncbi:MAG: DPP IV N-terminal domain-containing protein, partial [Gemmataceae bacterium]
MIRRLTPFALLLFAVPFAPAQERVTGANYPLAQKFTREFVAQHVQEANVSPQWIGKTDQFFYAARTPTGTRYWKVDPAKKEKVALFDHVALAAKLSEVSKKPLDGDTLRLTNPAVTEDGKKLSFVYAEYRYEYTLDKGELKQLGKAPQGGGGFGQMSADQIERMRQQLGDERVNEILRQQREQNRGDRQEQQQDNQNQQQQQQQQQDNQNQQQQNQNQQQRGTGTGPTPPAGGGQQFGYKNISPDKKKYVFAQKHNLYLGEEGQPDDKAVQLTKDGAENYSFAGGFGGFGGGGRRGGTGTGGTTGTDTSAQQADRKTRPSVTWSPDSKAFYVTRTDSRGVKDLWLVNSIATPRPALEQYAYPMPGEDAVRKPELYLCNVEKKEITRVTPKWKDERYYDVRWGKTGSTLQFLRRDRLQRNLEICKLDAISQKCECLFAEGFEAANLAFQTP